MPVEQYRLICGTAFNVSEFKEEALDPRVQYVAWGEEICPTTGKPHLQYFAYGAKMSVKAWREIFSPHMVTPCKGSLCDQYNYTMKEGKWHEIGVRPMRNGEQRSIQTLKRKLDAIAPSESVMDIAKSSDDMFSAVSRISRFAKEYAENVRKHQVKGDNSAPEVIYIYGPPGSGKTRYVREHEPDLYDVPADDGYKWKDGYSLDAAVLFDNLEPGKIKNHAQFLKEIDRYPIQCPVKGGFIWWKPKRIYITSIVDPRIMMRTFQDPMEFRRRVTKVIALPTI